MASCCIGSWVALSALFLQTGFYSLLSLYHASTSCIGSSPYCCQIQCGWYLYEELQAHGKTRYWSIEYMLPFQLGYVGPPARSIAVPPGVPSLTNNFIPVEVSMSLTLLSYLHTCYGETPNSTFLSSSGDLNGKSNVR